MALVLDFTATSSNLPAFLANWEADFSYRGNGSFNEIRNGADQWFAGTGDGSSVIVTGDDYSGTAGVVDGTVSSLVLGADLSYSPSSDTWSQDAGLSIDLAGATLSETWDAAISDLSQNGSLDGLYAYFAEQGTVQNGTVGNDTYFSFEGADTFVFDEKIGRDTVIGFDPCEGDVIDLSGVSWIGSYVDLLLHSNILSNPLGDLVLSNGSESITFTDYAAARIIIDGFGDSFAYA
jgi:hypothetical protein